MSGDEWGTPKWLYGLLDEEFSFELDVCASDKNHKHINYYTKKEDGLKSPWSSTNFCNPPYSDQMPWLLKALEERESHGALTVLLCKSDHSTRFWRRCFEEADEIRLIDKRISYEGASNCATFPSMIVIVGRVYRPCKVSLVHLVTRFGEE